jgi:hypothetical protein
MRREKRNAPREAAQLTVSLADGSRGTTRDVSATGLFFEIDDELEEGSMIDFSVDLAANGRAMRLTGQGEIVRIERHGKRSGIAVRIFDSRLEADD